MMFQVGGRTDLTKLIVTFRNFAKEPEIKLAKKKNKTRSHLAEHGDSSSAVGYRRKIKQYILGVSGLFGDISDILLIYSTKAGWDP